jgi:hypothetical protein
MASQWDNFLRNLGDWQGSFASLNTNGEILDTTPSLLTLEQGIGERLVHFRLSRFGADGLPSRQISQDYRSLGRQVVFFDSGSFCKGSLQVAPGTAFGAEFGFVAGDRRHRLVLLHSPEGAFESLVLIREFRADSGAQERPPLAWEQLVGSWSGQAATISADWPEPELADSNVLIGRGEGGQLQILGSGGAQGSTTGTAGLESGGQGERSLLLPDSGYCLVPPQVSHRAAFTVEAGWLPAPDRLERLIRRYDASGAWRSATWISASRTAPSTH